MIRLNHVNKYFNKNKSNQIHVIADTTLELADKGLVTFLGNSGCGKTTLLNAIGGLDNVNSGEILIDNQKITTRSSSKKDEIRNAAVGYIFQNYNLLEDETVFDNVALVLRMMGVKDAAEIEKRVMYILTKVGIDRYRNRPAKMLSGGERQRVGIARAIVKNPRIIIADEPTGNLDSHNTIEIMNIIKAISREKLVILVTHEREIAEFYASRIIEIVDGKVVSDKENSHDDELDYRMDNKIYLQDLPVQKTLTDEDLKIDYYSDQEDSGEALAIKVVVKNGHVYVRVPEGLSEGSEAVELIDDHYKKLSKDVYEDYRFDYDRMVDKNFKPKYTSIYNSWTMLKGGYKKIFSYSLIKKILLIGFILASMFSLYSVSSIMGITNITDDKFVSINKNYLIVQGTSLTPEMVENYNDMEGVDYVLPGTSAAMFNVPLDDYYQTSYASMTMVGSLADRKLLDEEALMLGTMPSDEKDLVIDKMVADDMLANSTTSMVGINSYEELLGRKVALPNLGEFTICGICDQGSPSIYADGNLLIDILINAPTDEEYQDDSIETIKYQSLDAMRQIEGFEIVSGTAPTADYQVAVNEMYSYEMPIGTELDQKVNGRKLEVCGFYSDKRSSNAYCVNDKMMEYMFIEQQSEMIISPSEGQKDQLLQTLQNQNVRVVDTYETARQDYIDSMMKQILATLLVSGIIMLISLIEIYLMLRASFLSRIKEVGVLRAIGLKKKDIYKMFVGEIIALTTLTSLPGIAVMSYIMNGISKIPYVGENYLMNPAVFLITLAIVFAFNLLAGLLPVFGTMRKTPAEILARNDVN